MNTPREIKTGPKNISQATSNKIANLSFVCSLLVVTIHVGPLHDEINSAWWFRMIFGQGISSFAVPFFFFVSGYFLAKHIDEKGWWKNAVKKRFFSLLIPMWLCSLISVLLIAPATFAADYIAGRMVGATIKTWADKIPDLLCIGIDAPFFTHLWYLRWLFCLVLFSPFIVLALRKAPVLWAIFILYDNLIGFDIPISNANGTLWFSMGVAASMRHWHCPKRKWELCMAAISLLAFKILLRYKGLAVMPCWIKSIDLAMQGAMICFAYQITSATRLPQILIQNAFPLYLFHWAFTTYTGFILSKLFLSPADALPTVLGCLLTICATLAFSILARQYLPKTSRIIFGGR